MQDREMVLDALAMVKHEIVDLTKAAIECSNQQLRQTIIQLRDTAEQNHMNLTQIANENKWYIPSPIVDSQLAQQVKQQLSSASFSTVGNPMHVKV
ncbi:MAG: spore coat protein [Firmicutes bacterium]|nr:spore coat protein [Bacillota bacterium]